MRMPTTSMLVLAATLLAGCLGSDALGASVTAAVVDGNTLVLEIDSCDADPTVASLDESDAEVRVRVERTRPLGSASEGDCIDEVTVDLEEPLGDRPLVDDARGTEIPVRQAG